MSTLSVDTSTRGSSTLTLSPTFFSQRVTVPSVTDSPRAGSTTDSLIVSNSLFIYLKSRRGRAKACRRGQGAPHPWLRSWLDERESR